MIWAGKRFSPRCHFAQRSPRYNHCCHQCLLDEGSVGKEKEIHSQNSFHHIPAQFNNQSCSLRKKLQQTTDTFNTSSMHYHGNLSKTGLRCYLPSDPQDKNQASVCRVQDLLSPGFISFYALSKSPGSIPRHTLFFLQSHQPPGSLFNSACWFMPLYLGHTGTSS